MRQTPGIVRDDSYGIALIEVRRDAQIEAVGHRVDRASLSLFERQLRLP